MGLGQHVNYVNSIPNFKWKGQGKTVNKKHMQRANLLRRRE